MCMHYTQIVDTFLMAYSYVHRHHVYVCLGVHAIPYTHFSHKIISFEYVNCTHVLACIEYHSCMYRTTTHTGRMTDCPTHLRLLLNGRRPNENAGHYT